MAYRRDMKGKGRAVDPGGPVFPNGRGGSQGERFSNSNSGPRSYREMRRVFGGQQQAPTQRMAARPFNNNGEGSNSNSRFVNNEHFDNAERFHNNGRSSNGTGSNSSMGSDNTVGPNDRMGPNHTIGPGPSFVPNDNRGQVNGIGPSRTKGPANGMRSNTGSSNRSMAPSHNPSLQGQGIGPIGNRGSNFNIPPNHPMGLNNRRGSTASNRSNPYEDEAPLPRIPLDTLLSVPMIPSADYDHNTRFTREDLEGILENLQAQDHGNGLRNRGGSAASVLNNEFEGDSSAFVAPSFGPHNGQNAAGPSTTHHGPSTNSDQSQNMVGHHGDAHNAAGPSVFYHQPWANGFESQDRGDSHSNGFFTAGPSVDYPQPLPDGYQPQQVGGTGSNNRQDLTAGYAMMPQMTVAPVLTLEPIGNGFHPGLTIGTGGSTPATGEPFLSATATSFVPRESTLERVLRRAGVVDVFSPRLSDPNPVPFATPNASLEILRLADVDDACGPRTPRGTRVIPDRLFIPDDHATQNERNTPDHNSIEPLGSAILGGEPLGPPVRLSFAELRSFDRIPGGYDRRPMLSDLFADLQLTLESQRVNAVDGENELDHNDEPEDEPEEEQEDEQEDKPGDQPRDDLGNDSGDAEEFPLLRQATTNSLPPSTPPQMGGESMARGATDPTGTMPLSTVVDVHGSAKAEEALEEDAETDEETPTTIRRID